MGKTYHIKADNYYLALSIVERVHIFRKAEFERKTDSVILDRWTNIKGLSSIIDTEYLCKQNGITLDEFTYAMKPFDMFEKQILVQAVAKMEWFKQLEEIIGAYVNGKDTLCQLESNISYPIRPFLYYLGEKITNLIDSLNIPMTGQAMSNVVDWAANILSNVIVKVVTLDLHYFKEKQQADSENSGEDMFKAYMKKYEDISDMLAFYEMYPVMTRLLVWKTQQILENITEMFTAFSSNIEEIKQLTGDSEPVIDKFSFGEGDTHSRGKTVTIIKFVSGKKLVYKPKNLKIDKKFAMLLKWVNEKGKDKLLEMQHCKSIYLDNCAFSEFIQNEECENEKQVSDYYERLGQLLFLIYILNGTDFHFENIISSGGQAYLIDIETLFQVVNVEAIYMEETVENQVSKEYADSVLAIGILPLLGLNQNSEGKSVDISALNGEQQVLPFKVLRLKNVNTADMIFDYDYAQLSDTQNIPIMNGKKVYFKEYSDSLVNGFANMAEFIMENKQEFLNTVYSLFSEAGIYVRQLTKATASYTVLQQYFNHPNYLKDMIYMERLFENLMSYPYADKRIVRYEIEDMIHGDVPIFFSELNNKDLVSSTGERIKDYMSVTALDRVLEKIKGLDDSAVSKQTKLLLNSIGRLRSERNAWIHKASESQIEEKNVTDDMVYEVVQQLNEQILEQKIAGKTDKDFTWANYSENSAKYEAMGYSYFTGISGLAVYFDKLAALSKNELFEQMRDALLEKLDKIPFKYYDMNINELPNIYAFVGAPKYFKKYEQYIIGLGNRILKGEAELTAAQKDIYRNLASSYYSAGKSEELAAIIKNEIIGVDGYEKEKNDIENILKDTPQNIWKNAEGDSYSGGVLFVVNALLDYYHISKNERYINAAKKIMEILVLFYKKEKDLRLPLGMNGADVSLGMGLAGVNYTLIRTFIDCTLPNIFCLKNSAAE